MANTVQIKRGNNTSVNAHTGPSGEIIYNLDTGRLHAQDGSTAGGKPHALISDVDLKANAAVTIEAGDGLTGGGTLAANRTLSLSSASIASLAKADTAVQPAIAITAGTGLTGGGTLAASRTVALNAASIASLGKADTALQAPGGSAGQILAKNSATTNDVVWVSSEAATAVSYGPQTLTAAQQAQARQNIQADKSYDSIASVAAATVPAFVNAIRTNGYQSAGDGGGALYKRVATEPTHAGKVQSADGSWWELSAKSLCIEMFGGNVQDTFNTASALNKPVDQTANVEYTISSKVTIPAGVVVMGSKMTTLKKASAFGTGDLIALGDGVVFTGLSIDGNRAGNTDNNDNVLVRIGDANNCVVAGNKFKSASGYHVTINSGKGNSVFGNEFSEYYMHGVAVYSNDGASFNKIYKNTFKEIGWGAIILGNLNAFDVYDNEIHGVLIGEGSTPVVVNTSGKTVTWVSGPNFSTIKVGHFLVVDNGKEFRISKVISDTALETFDTMPTLTNANASLGSGDTIGVIACKFGDVRDNTIRSTLTFGIAVSLGGNSTPCENVRVYGNKVFDTGKNGVNVSYDSGVSYLENNQVFCNELVNVGCGYGTTSEDRNAIRIDSSVTGKVDNTVVFGNVVRAGNGTMKATHWLGIGTLNWGSVLLGENSQIGCASATVAGDIDSITLSGFGSGAFVAESASYGRSVSVKINTGTGATGSPGITVLKRTDVMNPSGIISAQMVTGSGVALKQMWGLQQSQIGQWKAFYDGTPEDGGNLTVFLKG